MKYPNCEHHGKNNAPICRICGFNGPQKTIKKPTTDLTISKKRRVEGMKDKF